ncbi:hypothetical protein [Chitinophaga pinensis]|uniref:Uncharacterized protein n=1 Tax=Chitinophaga pinensis TaxID=79329 RepID=A0A5C6LTX1_9BACT|nr:hypothetical protein [Chitinophaga pinensis]TWW00124.1 hypothetical protein FEF09_12320 [Chitinophaga pinensis]
MNNLWHTNFRHAQEGPTTFRYYLTVHHSYDVYAANQQGLANHRPLIAAPASGPATESLPFTINSKTIYVESLKPAADGKGVIVWLVNTAASGTGVFFKAKDPATKLRITSTNMLEEYKQLLENIVTIPPKGIMMVRVEYK